MPSGGGVFLFTNEGVALKPDLLVSHAQALAVLLTDPNSAPSRPLTDRVFQVQRSLSGGAHLSSHLSTKTGQLHL